MSDPIDIARDLIRHGIPVMVARRATKPDGSWDYKGEFVPKKNKGRFVNGYLMPKWSGKSASESELDRYRPGDALFVITGHGFDLVDIDAHKGGAESLVGLYEADMMPTAFAVARTPSGGEHYFIKSLGVRSLDNAFAGIDVKAGVGGTGHGIAFIAPTVKFGKDAEGVDDEFRGVPSAYEWVQEPDFDAWAEASDDEGEALAAYINSVRAAEKSVVEDGGGEGLEYDQYSEAQQKRIDGYIESTLAGMESDLLAARSWPERRKGERKTLSNSWEELCFYTFRRAARLAKAQWNSLSMDEARRRMLAAAPQWEQTRDKWDKQELYAPPAELPFDVTTDRELPSTVPDDDLTLTDDNDVPIVDTNTQTAGTVAVDDVTPDTRRMEAFGWRKPEAIPESKRILRLELPASSKPVDVAKILVEKVFSSNDGYPVLLSWNYDWYVRENERWRVLADEDLRRAVSRVLWSSVTPQRNKPPKPWNPTPGSVQSVMACLAMELHVTNMIDPPCYLPGPPMWGAPDAKSLIPFRNGVVNAETGEFTEGINTRLFNLSSVNADYGRDVGDAVEWIRFLHSIFGDDPESIQLMREWGYYLLTGDRRQQKALMLIGPPRSGKGTILHILFDLLGLPASERATPTLSTLSSDFSTQVFIGKPLVVFADARIDKGANKEAVEKLLSIIGNDPQTIKRKYKADWVGELPSRIMLVTNELPRFNDASGALASRFVVLETKFSYLDREDTGLLDRLKHELPQILNWFLGAREEFVKRGRFVSNSTTTELRHEMKKAGAKIRAFIEEECVLGESEAVSRAAFRARYTQWCNENGYTAEGTRSVNADLRSMASEIPGFADPDTYRRRFNNSRSPERAYKGFRLRTPLDDAIDDDNAASDTDNGESDGEQGQFDDPLPPY